MHEKIVLLAEADYISTQWYQDTLSGILSQIKRYDMDFRVISHIPQEPVEEYQNGFVLLFGMSAAWMASAFAALEGLGNVVAINQNPKEVPRGVHTVSIDRTQGIFNAMQYLVRCGRNKIALFGVDPHSIGDRERMAAYLKMGRALEIPAGENDIFTSQELLQDCAIELCEKAVQYDSAICANDYSAVVLLRELKKRQIAVPEKMALVGYGNLDICRHTSPTLTSVTMDFREAGIQAAHIVKMLQRSGERANVSLTLDAQIVPRESTPAAMERAADRTKLLEKAQRTVAFQREPSVRKLQAINEMLSFSDEMDRVILRGICMGKTYQEIADENYISFPALKKRIRRMKQLCGVEGRQELERLVTEFDLQFNR